MQIMLNLSRHRVLYCLMCLLTVCQGLIFGTLDIDGSSSQKEISTSFTKKYSAKIACIPRMALSNGGNYLLY